MLKLGEKIINQIYLGDKKIAKVFWGDKLVYQASKPIFLDYIITDGNSYIDTEYCANENTVIEYTWETIEAPTASYNGLFGSRVATSNEEYHVFLQNGLQLRLDFGRYAEPSVYYKTTLNTKYTIKAGLGEIHINGELVKSYTPKQGQTKNSMYLGNFNNNGTPYTTGVKQKIYPCPIYENGVLVRNFKPCIAPNGQVAMYDEVNKKYHYGQGTGTLTAGNKINFVDYIIFDGNSYIDTEIKPIFGDELEITAQIGEAVAGKNYVLFGTGTSSIQFTGLIESKRVFNRYFGTTAGRSTNADTTATYHTYLFKNDGSVYQNGSLIVSPFTVTEATVNSNLTIGTRGYDTEYWLGNIYSVKLISAVGAVKLDLRPCVVAGIVGFYDMVSGKIFTNAGTGTLKASGRFVKSILFDGASYIDTGIAHQTCIVECDIRFAETGTRQLMGFGTSTAQYWGAGATGTFDYVSNTDATVKNNLVIQFNTDNPTAPTKTMFLNGKQIGGVSTGSSISNYTYIIGAAGTSTKAYFMTGEVWGNKFTNADGVVIQDLRPYVDSDGVACFKDLVTGNLFDNKGTGTLGYTE